MSSIDWDKIALPGDVDRAVGQINTETNLDFDPIELAYDDTMEALRTSTIAQAVEAERLRDLFDNLANRLRSLSWQIDTGSWPPRT